jgi:protein SCO1/2
MKKIIRLTFIAILIFTLEGVASCKHEEPKLDVMDTLGGDYTLTDQNGKAFNLKDLRGKAVLMFFGYTNCPDVCPITLAKFGAAYKKMGSDADEVKTVFISVDSQRDTPEKLKKYLSYFQYNPIGLTGTPEEISKVVRLFKVLFVKRLTGNSSGYLFDHSTATFLIDKQGRVRHLFGQTDRPETIATVISVLLKSG